MITSWSSKRLVEGKSMVSLQFITHQTDRYTYFESALMALEGGCKWIQLRMKEAPCEEVEAVALQLKPLCKEKKRSYFWMTTSNLPKSWKWTECIWAKRHADRSGDNYLEKHLLSEVRQIHSKMSYSTTVPEQITSASVLSGLPLQRKT